MQRPNFPFKEFDLDPLLGAKIIAAIEYEMQNNPTQSIKIQQISESFGFPPTYVKRALYLLFSQRKIKATYILRHKKCDTILSKQEDSPSSITQKIDNGDIDWCFKCNEPIESKDEIEIEMIFWNPQANV